MNKFKVTGFTFWGDSRFLGDDIDENDRPTPRDYADMKRAVVNYLADTDTFFLPEYHQHGEYGVPVLNDKYRFECSMRAWGRVLADAFGGDYVEYYCSLGDSYPIKLPDENMRKYNDN